jgi:hypothetical protein
MRRGEEKGEPLAPRRMTPQTKIANYARNLRLTAGAVAASANRRRMTAWSATLPGRAGL